MGPSSSSVIPPADDQQRAAARWLDRSAEAQRHRAGACLAQVSRRRSAAFHAEARQRFGERLTKMLAAQTLGYRPERAGAQLSQRQIITRDELPQPVLHW